MINSAILCVNNNKNNNRNNNNFLKDYIKIKSCFDKINFHAFFPNQSVLVNICPMETRQWRQCNWAKRWLMGPWTSPINYVRRFVFCPRDKFSCSLLAPKVFTFTSAFSCFTTKHNDHLECNIFWQKAVTKCVKHGHIWDGNIIHNFNVILYYIVITAANKSMHEILRLHTLIFSSVWQDIKSKAVNNCYMWDTIYKWVNISDINVDIYLYIGVAWFMWATMVIFWITMSCPNDGLLTSGIIRCFLKCRQIFKYAHSIFTLQLRWLV